MHACKFRLLDFAIRPNTRGEEMRAVRMIALPSEPFGMVDAADKRVPDPHASGCIELQVTPEFAEALELQVGDAFSVTFKKLDPD